MRRSGCITQGFWRRTLRRQNETVGKSSCRLKSGRTSKSEEKARGTHCDNTGSGHIILLVYGVKLVLWWDCASEVLEQFGFIHCLKKGQLCVNAVKTWPGLSWAILDQPGQYVIMEPGQPHAVVSPVNSAVSGWSFVMPKWLGNGVLRKMVNWEMGLIEKRLEALEIGSDSPFISGGPIEVMSHDLELWKMWLDCGVLNQELANKLKEIRDEMIERLEKIKEKHQPGKKVKSKRK